MAEDGDAKQEYTANQVQRNGNSTKTLENAHDTSQKMEGWLLKKQKVSNKWRNQYFKLTGTELCYGNSTEVRLIHFILQTFLYGVSAS